MRPRNVPLRQGGVTARANGQAILAPIGQVKARSLPHDKWEGPREALHQMGTTARAFTCGRKGRRRHGRERPERYAVAPRHFDSVKDLVEKRREVPQKRDVAGSERVRVEMHHVVPDRVHRPEVP